MIDPDHIPNPITQVEILHYTMETFESYIKQPLEFESKEEMIDYQKQVFGYFYMIKSLIEDVYR